MFVDFFLFFFLFLLFQSFSTFAHFVHAFDDNEDTEGNEKEINNVLEEITIGNNSLVTCAEEIVDFNGKRCEINTTSNEAN